MSVQIFQWQSQLALAKNALISGDYLTAEEYLNAAMTFSHDENAPEDAVADIFYHRGICFENKDRFVDARRAFNQAQHTFSRCLGATSSQAIKAGKAKCLVDIKMGRITEAQREFAEIIDLLKREPGDFSSEISSMETEMQNMLSHPEPPDIPGTEVEIEPYADSWTPVRRHPDASTQYPILQTDSTSTPFPPTRANDTSAPYSHTTSTSTPLAQTSAVVSNSPGVASEHSIDHAANRKVNIPADVADAIAHLSRSGQMAAVPESYINGGVTGRLTVDPEMFKRPSSEDDSEKEANKVAEELLLQEKEKREEEARRAEIEAHEQELKALKAEKEKERAAAEEAARKAEAEEQARLASEEAARKAEAEEQARIASEEAARKTEAEEQARIASEEAARKADEEEQARIASEEATRKAEAEEQARIASEEATRKAEAEEQARIASEEATRKTEAEEQARIASEEAARKTEAEEQARIAIEEAASKAQEEEQARRLAEEASRRAQEEEEEEKRLAAEVAQKAEEVARLAAEQAAAKADEEARKAALAARKAAEEEARIASAEAARKAREAREGKAKSELSAVDEQKQTAALYIDFELDKNLSLITAPPPKIKPDDFDEPEDAPAEDDAFRSAQPTADVGLNTSAKGNDPNPSTPDVKVRIVRSTPEAFSQKRLDGTMVDLAAFQAPDGSLVSPEPNLSFVKAQQPYPPELDRRQEPPVKPENQPERRSSILAQVAEELTGQIAGKIESQAIDKLASDVASSLAAEVSEAAHSSEFSAPSDRNTDLQARAHASKLASESTKEVSPKKGSTTGDFSAKTPSSTSGSLPKLNAFAAALIPGSTPATSAPTAKTQTPAPTAGSIPQPAAAQKPSTTNPSLRSAPLHTDTIMDIPARTFNPAMVDAPSLVEHEPLVPTASQSEEPLSSKADKSVDVTKLSEFHQRLSESAMASPPLDDSVEDKLETNKSSLRAGKTPPPVSQQKSLITPRHFIRPLNIPELTTSGERKYTQLATIAAVVIYGASILLFGIGLILMPLIIAISHTLDGISLGKMRGNGIKVTPEQFPEVYEAVHNLAASLGMPTAPETYVVNKPGVLNACAKRYHQRDYVLIYTDVLELAYSFGESELAFVISHELAHIQCGHLNRKWLDFPAKIVPFLGQALSRSREYTCDRIARELVPEGATMGLVALSVGTKLYRRINIKALYAQQDAVDDYWSWFGEVISSKPNLNSRIRALAPGEERGKVKAQAPANTRKR
jgi:Zn-dependent protease with chaperone function